MVIGWSTVLPGQRPDGTPYEAPGVAVLTYAGDGRFSDHHDLYDRVQLQELLLEAGLLQA